MDEKNAVWTTILMTILIDDSNDVESKVVTLSDAQKFVKDVLKFYG